MATIEYWIQLENHAWDVSPNNIDRMTGRALKDTPGGQAPEVVTLTSPVTGVTRKVTMFKPLRENGFVHSALLLRRYTKDWAAPDDRKVNPWDLNEPDPTDTGTMGTIPGPTIECSVGDQVLIHFRNLDLRKDPATGEFLPADSRTHSLHPHGFVFQPTSDGAYPLSPADPTQAVGAEAPAWASAGVTGQFKQGDRVPPPSDPAKPLATAATFTYDWNTFGWPSTAGVWLYHDHAVCDMENVTHGAIGVVVIHNANDKQDVDVRDPKDPTRYDPALLPGGAPNGSANGSPVTRRCIPLGVPIGVSPHDLTGVQATLANPPVFTAQHGELQLQLTQDLTQFHQICFPVFQAPPPRAQYLQLFHQLGHDAGMVINGRKYLGNTPTMIAGTGTLMRFGVVGMGTSASLHTFHLHGHRWTIPGPDGITPDTIMQSAEVRAVSQFEDTRLFGPANSFAFTINEGTTAGGLPSFMRAGGPSPALAKGEWHMHCHVLDHMMDGMMGSLMVVDGGDSALSLPRGKPCPEDSAMPTMPGMGGGATAAVTIKDAAFNATSFAPNPLTVKAGTVVTWTNSGPSTHTVSSDVAADPYDSGNITSGASFSHPFNTPGAFPYHCNIHPTMTGSVIVTP